MRTSSQVGFPSIEAAVNGDKHTLRLFLKAAAARIVALEQSTGGVAFNSDAQTPNNPVPPLAQLQSGSIGSGTSSIAVTNPQFLRTRTPGKNRGNILRTPITHRLRYSPDPTFKTGVTTIYSTQTHYIVPAGNHAELTSSFDGVNFNKAQVVKA